jgi:uncharacterized protein (TIGR00369 family)
VKRDQYTMCFGCGADNPHGLHLQVERQDDGTWLAEFTPQEYHCGWPGVVHGGVLCTALDEVMSYILFGDGRAAVTARMTTEFKHAVAPGEHLSVRAFPTHATRRVVDARSEMRRVDGTLVCAAEARFLVLSAEQKRAMGPGGSPGARVE